MLTLSCLLCAQLAYMTLCFSNFQLPAFPLAYSLSSTPTLRLPFPCLPFCPVSPCHLLVSVPGFPMSLLSPFRCTTSMSKHVTPASHRSCICCSTEAALRWCLLARSSAALPLCAQVTTGLWAVLQGTAAMSCLLRPCCCSCSCW